MLLPRFPGLPNHAAIQRAGSSWLTLLQLIRRHPRCFPIGDVQRFVDCTKRYIALCEELGWPFKPKHHFLMHTAQRILQMGSPALYGNWYDETLNKHLKNIAQAAHAAVWEQRILSEFRHSRGLEASAKRPKREPQ